MGKLTCQREQDAEIHHQHRPEDGHIEDVKPRARKRDGDGTRGAVPELELGQAPDEWPEFLVLFGWQRRAVCAVF
jgi:hypothetical protein